MLWGICMFFFGNEQFFIEKVIYFVFINFINLALK